eukprot:TRINITY_DN27927_c0_g1_i2.p2 TRINITY_DN27927_c0_g1~~TRINITY_DN27927_c0_g1_i2.p2  ORF type:complete len:129 (-),score=26.44 TRINITY_DN27927_c0_g1_i2:42-428(-)
MKGATWFIGGRMWKGETFFDAALRKVREEVSFNQSDLQPMRLLGVWNTFFDKSVHFSKDSGAAAPAGAATQTVNVVVHVQIRPGSDLNVELDARHDGFRWFRGDALQSEDLDPYVLDAMHELRKIRSR